MRQARSAGPMPPSRRRAVAGGGRAVTRDRHRVSRSRRPGAPGPVASPWLAALGLVALGWTALAHAASEAFPRPAQLEPDVQFWERVYSQVTTQGGLLHDDRFLDVVYEELSFPAGMSPRERACLLYTSPSPRD